MASATSSAAAVEVWVGWVEEAVGSVSPAGLVGPSVLDEEPGSVDELCEELLDDDVPRVEGPVAPVLGDTVPSGPLGEVAAGVGALPASGVTQAGSF